MDKSKSEQNVKQKSTFQHNPGTWLKIIIILHIFLSSGSISGSACAYSSLLYNLLFLQMLCWALSGKSITQSLEVAIFISVISFIFEVIGIWICFPTQKTVSQMFAFVFFILLIFLRPLEIYILWIIAMSTKDKIIIDHIGKQNILLHNRPKRGTKMTVETACVNEVIKYQPKKEHSLVSYSHSDPVFYQDNKEVDFQEKDERKAKKTCKSCPTAKDCISESMRHQRIHEKTCKVIVELPPRDKGGIPKTLKRSNDILSEGIYYMNNPVIYPGYIVPSQNSSKAKNFQLEPSQMCISKADNKQSCGDMEVTLTGHRRSRVSYEDGGEPIKSDFGCHPSNENTSAAAKSDRDNFKERNSIFSPIDKKKNRPGTKFNDISVSRNKDHYENREYRSARSTSPGSVSAKGLVGDTQDFIMCKDLAGLKLVFGDSRNENNDYNEDLGSKYTTKEKPQDKSIIIKQTKILDRSSPVAYIEKDKLKKDNEVFQSELVKVNNRTTYNKWQSFMKTKQDRDPISPLKHQTSLFESYDNNRLIPTVIHTYGQRKKNRALKFFGPNKKKNGPKRAVTPKIMSMQIDTTNFSQRSSIMANKKMRYSDKPYSVINQEKNFKYRS